VAMAAGVGVGVGVGVEEVGGAARTASPRHTRTVSALTTPSRTSASTAHFTALLAATALHAAALAEPSQLRPLTATVASRIADNTASL
jgi:hypothetical protein